MKKTFLNFPQFPSVFMTLLMLRADGFLKETFFHTSKIQKHYSLELLKHETACPKMCSAKK